MTDFWVKVRVTDPTGLDNIGTILTDVQNALDRTLAGYQPVVAYVGLTENGK